MITENSCGNLQFFMKNWQWMMTVFDYNFYTYGLRLYGNMPLIEPLESKEVKKIEEFVIIIDTSMSCSGELVRKFLEEPTVYLVRVRAFFTKNQCAHHSV